MDERFYDPPLAFADLRAELARVGYPAYPQPDWFKVLRIVEYRDSERKPRHVSEVQI
jgi:hypothetical protein